MFVCVMFLCLFVCDVYVYVCVCASAMDRYSILGFMQHRREAKYRLCLRIPCLVDREPPPGFEQVCVCV